MEDFCGTSFEKPTEQWPQNFVMELERTKRKTQKATIFSMLLVVMYSFNRDSCCFAPLLGITFLHYRH
jgi:hypothetical protein